MSLTPEQDSLLLGLGEGFLTYIAELTTYVFWYGMFVLLFAISVTLTVRRGVSGIPAKIIFGATVLSFLLSTLNVGTEIAGFIIFIRDALVNNVDVPLESRPAIVNQELVSPNTISAWAGYIPPVIGDGIVIWRAWVMFPEKQWVIIFPCILWLGTFGTILAYCSILTTPTGFASFAQGGRVDLIIRASIAMSIVTNLSGTLLIGWKLWSHRRFLSKDLGLGRRQTPVQKILIVLIESGLVYAAMQLTYFFLTIWTPGGGGSVSWFLVYTFSATYCMLSAMYPTIILVLVNLQRSINDVVGFSTRVDISPDIPHFKSTPGSGQAQRDATFGHLSFAAARTGQSDNDIEFEDSPIRTMNDVDKEKGVAPL